jgi:1,4-alpha-glucan branching enzyme
LKELFGSVVKNNQTRYTPEGSFQVELVRFEFTHATARAIGLAGTFNKWRPDVTPMMQWGDGRWMAELLLAPGAYEYRLVVDGEWMADPLAKETVPNPFGGRNSILRVTRSEGLAVKPNAITGAAKW